jgi:hypothetical protein
MLWRCEGNITGKFIGLVVRIGLDVVEDQTLAVTVVSIQFLLPVFYVY